MQETVVWSLGGEDGSSVATFSSTDRFCWQRVKQIPLVLLKFISYNPVGKVSENYTQPLKRIHLDQF